MDLSGVLFRSATLAGAALIALCLGLFSDTAQAGEDGLPPGLVKTKPAKGPFVETDRGFMVPYEAVIPGTDIKFQMVPIRGGKFKMGSPDSEKDRRADEGPQVEIEVAPFWIGKYETTWAEYKHYMSMYEVFKDFEIYKIRPLTAENRVDAITAPTKLYDPSFTYECGEDPRQPAATMTQYAARQYTKWLSGLTGQFYRLPAEAEWEYAARAGTTGAYSFGDDPKKLGDYAWYYDNCDEVTHPVGQKKPNPWGLYDIHGNVAEWTLDEYFEDGHKRLAGKTTKSLDSIAWPTKEFPRVVKGGSFDDDPQGCRSAARIGSDDEAWKGEDPNLPLSPWWYTSGPALGVGFRIVRPLEEPAKGDRAKYWEPDVETVRRDVKDRLTEGRGVLGVVDPKLPTAIEELNKKKAEAN